MAPKILLIALFSVSTLAGFSQGPPPPPNCPLPPCAPAPLDTNIVLLMAAGIGFALKKLYGRHKANQTILLP